eukprot:CAMPEP_0113405898 /NCGR_PEP_ID=MMETSP0013_2-20120614/19204_1 /TAXON_ID=2843 ORGANISM="Skeletonema costatum, Strain 1716" /NCGR_SAMPLE_ID=MMETSP0013_2 /ASSEMBLY_ACC=CAM_ASM_000158 /LENGTH=63 /DNA_ID=CAMNT_0000291669 /DNA_START=70 /DNA_END=261 /DNA_ORIENTATION=- /assembly_acc=CAM_ASM_000158
MNNDLNWLVNGRGTLMEIFLPVLAAALTINYAFEECNRRRQRQDPLLDGQFRPEEGPGPSDLL